jgi:hypothetical protein
MSSDLTYNLDAIRSKMRKKKGGKIKDPNEWRPDKAEVGKPLKYNFFILPPVESMDLWYYEHGAHWIDKQVTECPRLHDDIPCPLCQFGFDLMKESEDKDVRRQIAKDYLSSSRCAVNIYFPPIKSSPAEYRGKVMWFSMPQSVYSICEEVIMRDPPESDALEPEPYGIFYDPQNALPFVLEVKKKGDFNSYESSHFINKKMPLSKSGEDKVAEILDLRHDIPTLFQERSIDTLQSIVDNLTGNSPAKTPEKAEAAESKAKPEKESKTKSKTESKAKPQKEAALVTEEADLESAFEEDETPKADTPVAEATIEEDDGDLATLLDELNS